MRLGHPSARRLNRWLDGDEPGLDKHLASCDACAERLEHLDSAEGSPLREPLLSLLAPPDELPQRLRGTIDDRMRSRDDLALFSELFGLPIRAVRVMSTTRQGDR